MIDKVDFDKMHQYKDDKKHSFEEMCFQLCVEEFGMNGKFSSIDDSGGGDGVEYYLTLPNGDIWGWQCKFFDRFDEGGRKEQIKKSLKKAYDVHGDHLKKWFLCSKSSLTPAEKQWFDKDLKNTKTNKQTIIPKTAIIELVHWGDSELLNLLRKHIDVYNFFFNDIIMSVEWFKEKGSLALNKPSIRAKYKPELHSQTDSEKELYNIIGGKRQAEYLITLCSELNINDFETTYNFAIANLFNIVPDELYRSLIEDCKNKISPVYNIVQDGNALIKLFIQHAENNRLKECLMLVDKIETFYNRFNDSYKLLSETVDLGIAVSAIKGGEEALKIPERKRFNMDWKKTILGPYYVMRNYFSGYCNILMSMMKVKQNEFHIAGQASQGKSHAAINLFYNHYIDNLPAVLLSGREFKDSSSLETQILQLLDLPQDNWRFAKFLQILDWYGKIYDSKVIFLIDGLNEALHWKNIWSNNIGRLIGEFNNFNHILFITTYRSSYEQEIFQKDYFHLDGFFAKQVIIRGNGINTEDVIKKYSNYYKVSISSISPSAISIFRKEPLCLQIFFELNQNKTVEIKYNTVFQAFNGFIETCMTNIVDVAGLSGEIGKTKVKRLLARIVQYLWDNNANSIPLDQLEDVDEKLLDAFDKEDLLIYRDLRNVEGFVFTYDLIAGYLIARELVYSRDNKEKLRSLVSSDDFQKKLFDYNTRHSLFDVIRKCFILLCIEKHGFDFCSTLSLPIYDLIENVYEISNNELKRDFDTIESFLKSNFKAYSTMILGNALDIALDEDSVLNFSFTSQILRDIPITERDLKWTEIIRHENRFYNKIHSFLKNLSSNCKDKKGNPEQLFLGAIIAMWSLTSISHQQRYDATEALFWYAKRFPERFVEIVRLGNGINDVYVPERLYAVSYGIALTIKQGEEKLVSAFLRPIVSIIIKRFSIQSDETNCHYLLRFYCRGIIDIAKEHGIGLSQEDVNSVYTPKPFYTKEEVEAWEEIEDAISPIRMDFSNYQLGYIIPNGHSYANPPLKKKARWFIYDRIQRIGWNQNDFQSCDNQISSYSFYRHNDDTKVDRYGKKYSWIFYYELAGILDDLNMLDKRSEKRPIIPDLDPTFPEVLYREQRVLKADYLGSSMITTQEWLDNDVPMDIKPILYGDVIQNEVIGEENYICVYGYYCTKDSDKGRKRFTYIRPLIVKNAEYDEFYSLLVKQDLSGRWLPEIQSNYDVFVGEMYYNKIEKQSNWIDVSFVVGYDEIEIDNMVISDLAGLHKLPNYDYDHEKRMIKQRVPKNKEFKIFMPTMEYHYESEFVKGIGNCVSFEISISENLKPIAQSLELEDETGKNVSIIVGEERDFENSQEFVFLRKDVLDNFLKRNGLKMVWAVWGEKDHTEIPLELKVFQQFEEYVA
jgi:hypothetical protein